MKRFIYLLYYIKETDFSKFSEFVKFATIKSGRSKMSIIADAFWSSLKYNISLLDYFYFKFFKISDAERAEFAGTGFMYEYQLIMNPKGERDILEDKIKFLKHFHKFVFRMSASINELLGDDALCELLIKNDAGRIVVKGSRGQVGAEVKVINTKDLDSKGLLELMKDGKFDLAESYVVQHSSLMGLSPSGLNTVRVFTQLDKSNNVDLLGARLRITINSNVDNMAAGNPAAPVDLSTGRISGPAHFSDIRKEPISIHPITGVSIIDFQVPYWDKVIQMVKNAALYAGGNRSIGWDVAISEKGPELIEGNHNWCKILWQIPVNKGLKSVLLKYL